MGALFIAAAACCRSLNNSVLNVVAKTKIKSRSGHYLFATVVSAVALLFVIIISGGIPEIEDVDILHGIALGIIGIAEEFFILSAMECVSMAMTMICAMMSYSITQIAAVPLWSHSLDTLDWIGIALAIACVLVIMLNCFNKGIEGAHEKKEFSHWRIFVLILIVFTALIEIEEKSHVKVAASENHMGYYFVAFLTGTVFAGILFLIRYFGKKEKTQFVWNFKFILMILFCGIMKAFIYMVIGFANAVYAEEIVSMTTCSAVIILLMLIDRLYFKTRFTWTKYLAAGMAIAAMLCMR